MMGRHRKPEEFGDPDQLTDQHPVVVEEVDLTKAGANLRNKVSEKPPRHERQFEPMFRGLHHTAPQPKVGDQVPWPLVPRDVPLAAEREPLPPEPAEEEGSGGHGTMVWAVASTVVAVAATLLLLYTLLAEHVPNTAPCHQQLAPTVTVTAPAPP